MVSVEPNQEQFSVDIWAKIVENHLIGLSLPRKLIILLSSVSTGWYTDTAWKKRPFYLECGWGMMVFQVISV